MSLWRRLPVIVRAVITGFLVSLFGSVPWSILLQANLRAPRVPWAAALMALYLIVLWQYLRGRGWPRSTSGARRDNLRARLLSAPVCRWSLAAGASAIACLITLRLVLVRLIKLPPDQSLDFSRFPFITVLFLILMTAVVAGMVEEAAFRGYLQAPVERRHGPVIAIALSATLFGLAHFTGGSSAFLVVLPFLIGAGVIYGSLAYFSGSILPGVLLHACQDASILMLLWRFGTPAPRPTIWEAGTDSNFWICTAAAGLLAAASGLAFPRLIVLARHNKLVREAAK